jgi:hypothetical protein
MVNPRALVGLRWVGALGPLFKMQGKKQMVKWKARLRVKAPSFEVKSSGKRKGGSLSRAASRRLDRACGGCVTVGLGWVQVCRG